MKLLEMHLIDNINVHHLFMCKCFPCVNQDPSKFTVSVSIQFNAGAILLLDAAGGLIL